MKKNEIWKYILKFIIGLLLLSIVPVTFFLQHGVDKLQERERHMLTSDNPVNTIEEAFQFDKMSEDDKYNVCMQLLEPVRKHYQDYDKCIIDVQVPGYKYKLYRNGNVAKGTITDNNFVTYPVYCEKTDKGTFVRVFKDDTWYEEKIKDEYVIEINADFFENLIKNTNWDTAFVSDNEIYKPTPETNLVYVTGQGGYRGFAISPCEHVYLALNDGVVVSFLAIGYSDINMPDMEDSPVVSIENIGALFNEEEQE